MVPKCAASSSAVICSSPCLPTRTTGSPNCPGASRSTSTRNWSMHTFPTRGYRRPLIRTSPRFDSPRFSRGLSNRGDVLINGRRYPRVGNVCMDQFLVEVDRDAPVQFGDPVVLVGRQGEEQITAEELAAQLGTINYEITCSLTGRVRREYTGDSEVVENVEDHG